MFTRRSLLGFGLATFATLAGCARVGGEPAQFTANGGIGVTATQAVSQTVNPAGDAVRGVDVLVLAVPEPGDGNLTLALAADGKAIAAQTVALTDLEDEDKWVPFTFDQPVSVPDVVDVQLSVQGEGSVLIGANTTPKDVNPSREPTHDPYPQGEAVVDDNPVKGDIAFRIVGTRGPSGLPAQVSSIAKEGAKRLTAEPGFASIWALTLVAALALALWGFFTRKRG